VRAAQAQWQRRRSRNGDYDQSLGFDLFARPGYQLAVRSERFQDFRITQWRINRFNVENGNPLFAFAQLETRPPRLRYSDEQRICLR
jgi:hypothetical protein